MKEKQSTNYIFMVEPAEFYMNPQTLESNHYQIEDEDIRIALKEMFIDLNLQSISKKCFNLIDGKGVIRVAEALLKKNDLI